MKTKIVATFGPASSSKTIIQKMLSLGVEIARFNTKYGNQKEFDRFTKIIKEIGGCKILYDIIDIKRLKALKSSQFDYIALSFAEKASQIKKIRKIFAPKKIKIIAKIETDKGINNVDQIIKESDGIMVARGDLGKNILIERVPVIQKIIIKKCNRKRKFVITATHMLLSMIKNVVPERSEVSDVANAVLDGSSAVMLSEETAVGWHPVLAVKMMARIIKETEKDKKMLADGLA